MFRLKLLHRGLILLLVPLLCEVGFVISVVNVLNQYAPSIEQEVVAKTRWTLIQLIAQGLIDTSGSAFLFSKTKSPSMLQHYQKVKEFTGSKYVQSLNYFAAQQHDTRTIILMDRLQTNLLNWWECQDSLIKGDDCKKIAELYTGQKRKQWSDYFTSAAEWPLKFIAEKNDAYLANSELSREEFDNRIRLLELLYLLLSVVVTGVLTAEFYFRIDKKMGRLKLDAKLVKTHSKLPPPLGGGDEISMVESNIHTLLRSRVELERFEKDLTNIVGTELQVPLTSLQNMLYLLTQSREEMDERTRKSLERAEQNISWLIKLINDLLALETARSGGKHIFVTPFSLQSMLERAVAQVQPLAAQENVVVDLYGTDGVVRGDFEELTTACVNILSNAIRASALGGKIIVDFEGTADGALIKISDSGTGVPESIKDKIFEVFQIQPDRILTEEVPSGLELPLAHSIITQHGGEITLESVARRGCIYTWKINNNFDRARPEMVAAAPVKRGGAPK